MAVQVVLDTLVGDLRTITLEGDEWKRVVIVVDKSKMVHVNFIDGDSNRMLLEITPLPTGQ